MMAISHPLKALTVSLRGIRTEGPMAPEIPLQNARPAETVPEVPAGFELPPSVAAE